MRQRVTIEKQGCQHPWKGTPTHKTKCYLTKGHLNIEVLD